MEQTARISSEPNPYAAPHVVSEEVIPDPSPQDFGGLRWTVLIQCVVIACMLGAQLVNIETIVFSGPIFALFGLVILIQSGIARRSAGIWFGASSIVFVVFVYGLIDVNRWTPTEARLPVMTLSWVYLIAVAPLIHALVRRKSRTG